MITNNQIDIIIGRFFLGLEDASSELDSLRYTHIPNEYVRFVFIAMRALKCFQGYRPTKQEVLEYIGKETFITKRDLLYYSEAIDKAIYEAAMFQASKNAQV